MEGEKSDFNTSGFLTSQDYSEIFWILTRRFKLIVGIVSVCVTIALVSAFVIPKKYKSSTTLTIYNKYFQLPLIGGFLPESTDTHELKIQRESLIRQALDEDFLEQLGEKYSLFHYPKDHLSRPEERQDLLRKIEVISLNNATYEIAYISSNPEICYQVVSDILQKVSQTFVIERLKTITNLRDSIRRNIEKMSMTFKYTTDPVASDRPEVLIQEKMRLDSQIKSLTTQYTARHPTVARLVERANVINRWLKDNATNERQHGVSNLSKPLLGVHSSDAEEEVYADLLQKLNFLNIVLESESNDKPTFLGVITPPFRPYKALWPRKSVFLIWGLAAGLMVACFYVFCLEYFQRMKAKRVSRLTLSEIARTPTAALQTNRSKSENHVWN